jgi:acetoin utilization deacetylase AcuC-like enzyme
MYTVITTTVLGSMGATHSSYKGDEVAVFYSPHDETSEHQGIRGNAPEDRKRLVLVALRAQEERRRSEEGSVRVEAVVDPEVNLDLAKLVHDEHMLDFLLGAWVEWDAAIGGVPVPVPGEGGEGTRKEAVLKLLEQRGISDHLADYCGSESYGGFGLMPYYYAPRHDACQMPGPNLDGRLAYYGVDRETPITPTTAISLRHDLAVTRKAVEEVLRFAQGERNQESETGETSKERAAAARIAYALVTHPGHHAGPSSYGGFCFVNSAAVAASMLRKTFGRVAIIDVDHHHGNGTMAIFWDDPTVTKSLV